jgi:hypothetical protein
VWLPKIGKACKDAPKEVNTFIPNRGRDMTSTQDHEEDRKVGAARILVSKTARGVEAVAGDVPGEHARQA